MVDGTPPPRVTRGDGVAVRHRSQTMLTALTRTSHFQPSSDSSPRRASFFLFFFKNAMVERTYTCSLKPCSSPVIDSVEVTVETNCTHCAAVTRRNAWPAVTESKSREEPGSQELTCGDRRRVRQGSLPSDKSRQRAPPCPPGALSSLASLNLFSLSLSLSPLRSISTLFPPGTP